MEDIEKIFTKHGILPPNSSPVIYGNHLSIIEPVYTELLKDLTNLIHKACNQSRINTLHQLKIDYMKHKLTTPTKSHMSIESFIEMQLRT